MAAAIDYVRTSAVKFGADPDRICLGANSAGGPLLTIGLGEKRSREIPIFVARAGR